MKHLSLILLVILSFQCTMLRQSSGSVTVEGRASVRGNEPFTSVLLETAEGHAYVLVFTDDERATLDASLPAQIRVTGTVRVAKWYGLPILHLSVESIEHL